MIKIESIPYPLKWTLEPDHWSLEAGTLSATAGPKTDLFVSPFGQPPIHNAPMLLFNPTGDFMLSALVKVEFAATFDAGVLVIYQSPSSWAKLCFEYSPTGEPMMVSVVTKGTSDDCNSVVIQGNQVYVRIARIDDGFAFHYSINGKYWHMLRVFRLEPLPTRLGFLFQAPTGQGCTAQFSEIKYQANRLEDHRSGE